MFLTDVKWKNQINNNINNSLLIANVQSASQSEETHNRVMKQ